MTASPHFAFPFRLGRGGKFAVVAEDSLDEITQNVEVILRTQIGTRLEIPDFGTDTLLFEQQGGSDLDEVLVQVTEWEPRATVVAEESPDRLDDLVRRVRVVVGRIGGE